MEVVVDGTDGGGKTPLVDAICAALVARGLRVARCAPYRVVEVFPLWASDPVRAATTIGRVMDDFRASEPDAEVIVWDRGWPTAWVSTDDAEALAALGPAPTLTVLLLNSMDTTRMRAAKHRSTAPWMVEEALIHRFSRAYHALTEPAARADRGPVLPYVASEEGRFDLAAITADVLAGLP